MDGDKGDMNLQQGPPPQYGQPQYGQPQYGQPQPQTTVIVGGTTAVVPGYQRWSWGIVVLSVFGLFCCQCFGIVSLLAAMTAYSDHKTKDFAGEQRKRKIAKGFGIAAIVIGCLALVIFIIAYIVTIVAVASAVNNSYNYGYYDNNYGK